MKNRSNFIVWLVGSAALMLMFFQNCGKKSATYDTVNSSSSSSNNGMSTNGVNSVAVNCDLSSNSIEISPGQTLTYAIQPSATLPTGYRVFWEGSRTDIDGSNYSALPATGYTSTLQSTVTYDSTVTPGYYTRSVRVQSAGGDQICASNTVRVLFKDPNSTTGSSTTTTTVVNNAPIYTSQNCPNGTVTAGFCYVTFETKDLTGQNAYYVDGYTLTLANAKTALNALCAAKNANLIASLSTTSPTCEAYPITYANGGASLVPVYGSTVTTSAGAVPFVFKYQNAWRLSTTITNWSSSPVTGMFYCKNKEYVKTLTCRSKTAL